MKIRIGTSGFQYPEWRGRFYPEKFPTTRMLAFYAEHFPTTEINYSFRHLPGPATLGNWSRQTPGEFVFSLKAPQRITHFAKLRDCAEATGHFFDVVGSLGDKLGPVLFQLPPNLTQDISLLRDFLATLPKGARAAMEFRHESWFDDTVYAALREAGVALCLAESDSLQTPFAVTGPFGYLRLRRKDYTEKELASWAERIRKQEGGWRDVFIYFKHEEEGTGPRFAIALKDQLAA